MFGASCQHKYLVMQTQAKLIVNLQTLLPLLVLIVSTLMVNKCFIYIPNLLIRTFSAEVCRCINNDVTLSRLQMLMFRIHKLLHWLLYNH